MTKKFCLLIGVVFIVSSGVCAFGQDQDILDAAEVLRRYKESLSWLQSISMKIDIEIDKADSRSVREFIPRKTNFVFRRDHDRTEWMGELLTLDQKGAVDASKSFIFKDVMTGERYLYVSSPINELSDTAMITKNYEERQKNLLDSPNYGGVLGGRIFGNSHKSIAELLGESGNLHLRDNPEDINGVSCYVLEATTKHGRVTAWIAPEKGYNALKWSIHKSKTRGDLFDKIWFSTKWPEIEDWTVVFDSVEVEEVNDVFVTRGCVLSHTNNLADGRTTIVRHKYKVSEVKISPDFDALGAFKIDLPNGTRVFVEEYPGIRYVWQNGKIVPDVDAPTFEEIDKMVDEIKKEKEANSGGD